MQLYSSINDDILLKNTRKICEANFASLNCHFRDVTSRPAAHETPPAGRHWARLEFILACLRLRHCVILQEDTKVSHKLSASYIKNEHYYIYSRVYHGNATSN
jgi:hypothetical protein